MSGKTTEGLRYSNSDPGQITPEQRKALSDKRIDTYRRRVLKLLRNRRIPLTQHTRDWTAEQLEQLWWPDPKAEKLRCRRLTAQALRDELKETEARFRQEGVKRPRGAAKEEVAREFGYPNGEALRKALQPNRVNRRPRRKPRD